MSRLRQLPDVLAEVEAARAWGVPRSEFLSWPDDDRGWALALLALDADTCSGCGHPLSESMDAANQFAYRAEPVRCFACAAADTAADKQENKSGLRVRTVRRG